MGPLRLAWAQDLHTNRAVCDLGYLVPEHTDFRTPPWPNRIKERTAVVEVPDNQGPDAGRGRKNCPPHGPYVVDVVGHGSYVAHCLACGLGGPEGEDVLQAKLAFDQRWH